MLLRLGDQPHPPPPVPALLPEHIASRDNMNTATNPASAGFSRAAGRASRPDRITCPHC